MSRMRPDPRYDGRLYNWEVLRKFCGGRHTWSERCYFRDVNSGRIGVANESGRRPHTTCEGVLWLDTTCQRPILGPSPGSEHAEFRIPLLDVEQQKTCIPVFPAEALWLSAKFNIPIKLPLGRDDFFNVTVKIEGV